MPPDAPRDAAAFQAATGVSRETLNRLQTYADLLQQWNQRVNLVGRGTLPDLWSRHMLDSAQLVPLLPSAPEGRERAIVDLGSGAGFPGLVLAIMGAGHAHLIESVRKKATFLHAAVRQTNAPATVHACRIADAPAIRADVVTARAFAPLAQLLPKAAQFCDSDSMALVHKGRSADRELTDARKAWNIRVTEHPSRTDPRGRILAIAGLG